MTDWTCPRCGGGFPTTIKNEDGIADQRNYDCPWCGLAIGALKTEYKNDAQ